jgi:hypothetical protein
MMEFTMANAAESFRDLSEAELEIATGGIVIGSIIGSLDAGSLVMLNPQPLPPIWEKFGPAPEPWSVVEQIGFAF